MVLSFFRLFHSSTPLWSHYPNLPLPVAHASQLFQHYRPFPCVAKVTRFRPRTQHRVLRCEPNGTIFPFPLHDPCQRRLLGFFPICRAVDMWASRMMSTYPRLDLWALWATGMLSTSPQVLRGVGKCSVPFLYRGRSERNRVSHLGPGLSCQGSCNGLCLWACNVTRGGSSGWG